MYHPDKAQHKSADGKKEDRSVFLKVQEAFNVLSNETKRRAYDSQLPFDETTPTEERVAKALEKGPKKFFKLYDAVFKRNARFAVKKPVPEIGGEETPMADVRTAIFLHTMHSKMFRVLEAIRVLQYEAMNIVLLILCWMCIVFIIQSC